MRIVYQLLFWLIPLGSVAQFYVSPGAQVQLTGNAEMSFWNVDFINRGSFAAGNSTIYFSGTSSTYIGGSQPVQFYSIQINKSIGQGVFLYRPVGVADELQLVQGFVDLNGYDLDLGSTGMLLNETESNRIMGAAGGEVVRSAVLDAPVKVNPGNLGAIISSTQNLGNVTIRRGHQAPAIRTGTAIERYYNITPDNNSSLAATFQFKYFDAELNGQTEAALGFWRSQNGADWTYEGFSGRDAALNMAEKNGIAAFSVWTLSSQTIPLPVTFAGFRIQCDAGRVTIHWKTAQEFNSKNFVIEKNTGGNWLAIGQVEAAGNSTTEKSYAFTDYDPAGNAQYRLAQYDIDGQVKYSSMLMSNCSVATSLQYWPNPFSGSVTLRAYCERNGQVLLTVTNINGAIVFSRQLLLQKGINQFDIGLQQAAAGTYLLRLTWMDGRPATTLQLIKQ